MTSTAYPVMDGCLEEVVVNAGGELEYMSSTAVIIALAPDDAEPTEVRFGSFGTLVHCAAV